MLSDYLIQVYQRTGLQNLFTREGINAFQRALREDLGGIIYQINTVHKPLFEGLAEFTGNDPLEIGISANTLWADSDATPDSNGVFYDQDAERKTTVKEAIEVLLARIEALEQAS